MSCAPSRRACRRRQPCPRRRPSPLPAESAPTAAPSTRPRGVYVAEAESLAGGGAVRRRAGAAAGAPARSDSADRGRDRRRSRRVGGLSLDDAAGTGGGHSAARSGPAAGWSQLRPTRRAARRSRSPAIHTRSGSTSPACAGSGCACRWTAGLPWNARSPAGERMPFGADRSIVVRAGDAGAVTVRVGPDDQGPLGRDGQVVTRAFNVGAAVRLSGTGTPRSTDRSRRTRRRG